MLHINELQKINGVVISAAVDIINETNLKQHCIIYTNMEYGSKQLLNPAHSGNPNNRCNLG